MNILYFTAEWCGPCKKTRPIVEELNKEGTGIKFTIVDVDSEKELVSKFNVQKVPTFVLIKDGIEVKRAIGGQTRQQLEQFSEQDQKIV